ncbi:MAG: hypothetical protein KIH62_003805 [Candidatus Kerfeldbacteria bacterium]|nr:hypothetical protein [Candidatus Kerfeldbacteria bacterium]
MKEIWRKGLRNLAVAATALSLESGDAHAKNVPNTEIPTHAASGEKQDYAPSRLHALTQPFEAVTSPEITGGFPEGFDLYHEFGAFVSLTTDEERAALLARYADRLPTDPSVIAAFEEVIQDRGIYTAIQAWLVDGGLFSMGTWGRYVPEKKVIYIGPEDYKDTIVHEILHYVFDKYDNELSEVRVIGGADHFAINPIVERFHIVESIRHGGNPLRLVGQLGQEERSLGERISLSVEANAGAEIAQSLDEYYRSATEERVDALIESNRSLDELRSLHVRLPSGGALELTEGGRSPEPVFLISPERLEIFVWKLKPEHVHTILLAVPHEEDMNEVQRHLEQYMSDPTVGERASLSISQLQDVAYLEAYAVALKAQALYLAVRFSEKRGMPLSSVFADPEYQRMYRRAVEILGKHQERKPNQSLYITARRAVDRLI